MPRSKTHEDQVTYVFSAALQERGVPLSRIAGEMMGLSVQRPNEGDELYVYGHGFVGVITRDSNGIERIQMDEPLYGRSQLCAVGFARAVRRDERILGTMRAIHQHFGKSPAAA